MPLLIENDLDAVHFYFPSAQSGLVGSALDILYLNNSKEFLCPAFFLVEPDGGMVRLIKNELHQTLWKNPLPCIMKVLVM